MLSRTNTVGKNISNHIQQIITHLPNVQSSSQPVNHIMDRDEYSQPTGTGPTTAQYNASSRLHRAWTKNLLVLYERVNTKVNTEYGSQAREAFKDRKFLPLLKDKRLVQEEFTMPWPNVVPDLLDIRNIVSETLEEVWDEMRVDPGLKLEAASDIRVPRIEIKFKWQHPERRGPGAEFDIIYRFEASFNYPTPDDRPRACGREGCVTISSKASTHPDGERLRVIEDPSGVTVATFSNAEFPSSQMKEISQHAADSLSETASFQTFFIKLAEQSESVDPYDAVSGSTTASVTQYTPSSSTYRGSAVDHRPYEQRYPYE